MSKIIKHVQINNLPVVINSLRLVVPDENIPVATEQFPISCIQKLNEKAEEEAAALVAKARLDMEEEAKILYAQSRETGYTDGFAEGRQQGFSEGKQQGTTEGFAEGKQAAIDQMEAAIRQSAEEAATIMKVASQTAKQTVLSAEHQIVELAITIAEKILVMSIDADSQAVVGIVKKTMEKVRNQEQIIVRVNPRDLAAVSAAKAELEAIFQREQSVELTTDQTVSRGGCVIDTTFGSVDARLETQLQSLRTAIESLLPC